MVVIVLFIALLLKKFRVTLHNCFGLSGCAQNCDVRL